MSRSLLCFSFLIFSLTAISQKYKPADAGSKVHFVIKNFGIETGGDLSGLSGNISFIPSNISASNFDVTASVKTIDTDNKMRDTDLKKKKYFDADTYPIIEIKSIKVDRTNKTAAGWYYFTGTLTMHGVTKPIEFPFSATEKGADYLFVGGFTINRLDYGVGGNSAVLGNTVKISLSVLAKKS